MTRPVPTHPEDDRLLELAYGEVPASEARTLRQHVDGCARCRKVLDGIADVRTAFRSIPEEPAPERGLESLLAYGEQAAARARSRRGGFRLLALLSAATAFAVVWLLVPAPSRQSDSLARVPATKPPDVLAQAEVPREASQGDRARDEVDRAKDAKENESRVLQPVATRKAEPMARAEQLQEEQPAPGRRSAAEQLSKQKAMAKLDAPKEQAKVAEAPAASPSDRETAGAGSLSGVLGSAAGGKAGSAAGPTPMSGAGALSAGSAAGAEKKRSSSERLDDGARNATGKAPSSPPSTVAATPAPGQPQGEDVRLQSMGKLAAAPRSEVAASEDKAAAAADAVSAPASSPPAKTASKPVPPVQSMRAGAGSPEKQARLAEIRRQLETAKGDQRKALLLEKCEIEASLQLGPDVVLTCSMVTREFPGTAEAKRASELARGFSVQLPTGSER